MTPPHNICFRRALLRILAGHKHIHSWACSSSSSRPCVGQPREVSRGRAAACTAALFTFWLLHQVTHFYCPQTVIVVRAVPKVEALGFKGFGWASWRFGRGLRVTERQLFTWREAELFPPSVFSLSLWCLTLPL